MGGEALSISMHMGRCVRKPKHGSGIDFGCYYLLIGMVFSGIKQP